MHCPCLLRPLASPRFWWQLERVMQSLWKWPPSPWEELLSRVSNTSLRRVLGPKLWLDLRSEVRVPLNWEATLPAVHTPSLSCLSAGPQREENLAVFWNLQKAGFPPRISGQNLPALGKEAWGIAPWTSRRRAGNSLAGLFLWALLLRNPIREQRGVWTEKRRDGGELCLQGGCPYRMSLCGCDPWGVRPLFKGATVTVPQWLSLCLHMCVSTAAQLGRVGELGPSRQPGIRSLRFVFSSNTRIGVALAGNCPLLPTWLHASVSLCSHTHSSLPPGALWVWAPLITFRARRVSKESALFFIHKLPSDPDLALQYPLASRWLF